MLMGFADVMKDRIPGFVRDMAEKIFFCNLSRLQCFCMEIPICLRIFADNSKPLLLQRFIQATEAGGCVTVYVDFRVGHEPDKFIMRGNLTEKPVIDMTAFQQFHHFIA